MMISTKGRYALRVMIDLAENYGKGYAPMIEVAQRQEISLKYLERILPVLTKNKMIEGLEPKKDLYKRLRRMAALFLRRFISKTDVSIAHSISYKADTASADPARSFYLQYSYNV